jgi:hypothetical protein
VEKRAGSLRPGTSGAETSAAAVGSARGIATAASKLEIGLYVEACIREVQPDGFGLIIEFLIHQKGKVVVLHDLVLFSRLVQSQRKPWAPSTSGQVDPDGLLVLACKVLFQLLSGGWRQLDHDFLLLRSVDGHHELSSDFGFVKRLKHRDAPESLTLVRE